MKNQIKKISRFRVFVTGVLVVASFCLLKANAQENPNPKSAMSPLLPKDIVTKLIQAAQNNDLDGVLSTADVTAIAKGHHGRQPLDLVSTLRNIDLDKTRFIASTQLGNPLKAKEKVSIEGKYHLDFDLELRTRTRILQGDKLVDLPAHYVVVSVHP